MHNVVRGGSLLLAVGLAVALVGNPFGRNTAHHIEGLGGIVGRDVAGTVFSVKLSSPDFGDDKLPLLTEFPELSELALTKTKISDDGLKVLETFPRLKRLNLSGNRAITDAGLKHLHGLSELRFLNLNRTSVTDDGLEILNGLPQLMSVELDGTRVTYHGVRQFQQKNPHLALTISPLTLCGLDILHRVGRTVDAELDADGRLETLELRGKDVSDAVLTHLRGHDAVRVVCVGESPITDAGLAILAELPNLEELDLSMTRITDAGLEHLAGLSNLATLSLNGTSIRGPGLTHLRNLERLTTVDLSQTPVDDEAMTFLSEFPQLQTLRMAGCGGLSDAGLQILARRETLKAIDLTSTGIGNEGLAALSRLPRLESVDLNQTHVSAEGLRTLQSALPNLQINIDTLTVAGLDAWRPLGYNVSATLDSHWNLSRLSVGGDDVNDEMFATLEGRVHLKTLHFSARNISSKALEVLWTLPNLTELAVTWGDDEQLAIVGQLKGLESLHFFSEDVTDAGVVHLSGLVQLQELRFNAPQVTEAGLIHLVALPRLRRLSLTHVTDSTFRAIAQAANLEELALWQSNLTDDGLKAIERLSHLEDLYIEGGTIQGPGLASLSGLRELKTLSLSYTQTTDAGLAQLGRVSSLQSLSLHHLPITDKGLTHLEQLPHLQELSISGMTSPASPMQLSLEAVETFHRKHPQLKFQVR